MRNKIAKPKFYITWDEKKFDNPLEGAKYDNAAFNKVCNKVYFFLYKEYDSFDLIPTSEYDLMRTDMQIFHTDGLPLFYFYLLRAPFFYTHDDEAAAVVNGLLHVPSKDIRSDDITRGFTFFSESANKFLSAGALSNEITSLPSFTSLMNTVENFVKENI